MAAVRYEALRALQEAIVEAVPRLDGKVCVGQATADHNLAFPSLSINAVRWAWKPDQADDVGSQPPDRAVMNVGRFEGLIQMRLQAATPQERYVFEEAIMQAFLATPGHPGVIVTPVLTCPDYGDFVAAWELDEDEWANERAFDGQFASLLTVTGQVPALVLRGEAWTIEQLQLAMSEDESSNTSPATFGQDSEVVQVNEDGSITAVP